MLRYACTQPEQAKTLCILAAAGVSGVLAGVLCFLAFGERASAEDFAAFYRAARAFTAYETAGAYLSYFAGWFCRYAVRIGGVLFCACTFYPLAGVSLFCFVRGLTSGFGVCALGGRFSVFCVFYASVQGALLCLLGMVGAKSVSYVRHKTDRIRKGNAVRGLLCDPAWISGELLPLLAGTASALGILVFGLLAVSGIACFLPE